MKISTLLFVVVIFILYSCNDSNDSNDTITTTKAVAPIVSQYTPPSDLFKMVSDSFRKYSHISLMKLIEGNSDSSSYYAGKAEAYYSVEGMILYRVTPKN